VNDLQFGRGLKQAWQRAEDKIIDTGSALAAARHEQKRAGRMRAQRDAGSGGIAAFELRADRRAGAKNVRVMKAAGGGGKTNKRLGDNMGRASGWLCRESCSIHAEMSPRHSHGRQHGRSGW